MPVEIIETIAALRARLQPFRSEAHTIGLVPTMGALHAGHVRLIEQAARECSPVVVSIFVNPTQFNQPEDFAKYPRTFEADAAACESAGARIIFAPTAEEMYPGQQFTTVEVSALGDHLCGQFRPGHFRGVATVVTKLLQIVQPHRAYFGEKDAQQLAIIQQMVRDLNIPVEIVPVATVREPDGLAMSSRNLRLKPEERAVAPVIYQALQQVASALDAGERDTVRATQSARERLSAAHPQIRLEYLEAVDPQTLQPLAQIDSSALIAIAAWLGDVRLIDNLRWRC